MITFKRSLIASLLALAGCSSTASKPIALVDHVDLDRFMGDWHVIANIPTFIEKGAHNAIESYRRAPDGTIETTFTFRADRFDGPERRYTPRGFVLDHSSNAVWGMQFLWPIKSDFRIVYLTPDYQQTVIGREARDYVWIMARTPEIPESDFRNILVFLEAQGYAIDRIRKVPQQSASHRTPPVGAIRDEGSRSGSGG